MQIEVVGLKLNPNFFLYLVKPKPEPDLSPIYLVNFSSQTKTSLKYET
jgi:hypothetical protein